MNPPTEYSVILPAYLEEENLRILLPRIHETLEQTRSRYEILVIDTPQPLDKTKEVADRNGALYIPRQPGSSFGDAVRTGISKATGRWLIFMDADGSHSPEFIPSLLNEIPANDIVIASRYIGGGCTDNSRSLVLMSRVLNLSYGLALGLKYKDISNSFKVYRADWIKELRLRCSNFDIIQEILVKLKAAHPEMKVKEIPFSFKQRMFGETKRDLISFIFTYLFTIIKLKALIWFDFLSSPKKSKPKIESSEADSKILPS